MSDNIVSLVPKVNKETNSYVETIFSDNTTEVFDVDYFGSSDSVPGFIMMWKEDDNGEVKTNSDVLYINMNCIKMIKVISEEVIDEQ